MAITETKARIEDIEKTEASIKDAGASFVTSRTLTDTYYAQNPGRILKVSEDGTRTQITRLRRIGDRFSIESREDLPPDEKELLAEQLGIHRILRKQRKTYALKDHILHLDSVEELGAFLVIEGVSPGTILATIGMHDATLILTPLSDVRHVP